MSDFTAALHWHNRGQGKGTDQECSCIFSIILTYIETIIKSHLLIVLVSVFEAVILVIIYAVTKLTLKNNLIPTANTVFLF